MDCAGLLRFGMLSGVWVVFCGFDLVCWLGIDLLLVGLRFDGVFLGLVGLRSGTSGGCWVLCVCVGVSCVFDFLRFGCGYFGLQLASD